MVQSMEPAQALASLRLLWPVALVLELLPIIKQIGQAIQQFRSSWPTPSSTFRFENQLKKLFLEVARLIVQWSYNHIEPADPELMLGQIHYAGDDYRRKRRKTANRNAMNLSRNSFSYQILT